MGAGGFIMRTVFIILRNGWLTAFLVGLLAVVLQAQAGTVADQALYAELLARHLKQGTVDYRGLKQDEALLDRYLESLARVAPEALPPAARFAHWVNAYNAWTLKLILKHYPGITSIKEAGSWLRSPWKLRFVRQHDRLLTLDEIEHDILRPQFKDPRVHFAINCASKGCPSLYPEPFDGNELARQLDDAARNFINDPARYRLEGETLYVSRIFDWFREDFNNDPLGFFKRYAQGPLAGQLAQKGDRLQVAYLEYDWSLNGK
jgi:hypothetical protein